MPVLEVSWLLLKKLLTSTEPFFMNCRLKIQIENFPSFVFVFNPLTTLNELLLAVTDKTKILPGAQLLSVGFPPSIVRGRADDVLKECGLSGGLLLHGKEVKERSGDQTLIADGIEVFRKVIDADNSCLFNSVGFAFTDNCQSQEVLRQIVASSILSHPEIYTCDILEMTPEAYSSWIRLPEKWGGEIELSILAKHFSKEIAVVDVGSGNIYVYGELNSSTTFEIEKERCYLLYDGVHYDLLGKSLKTDGSELNSHVFSNSSLMRQKKTEEYVFSSKDMEFYHACQDYARDQHSAKQFVNLGVGTLECLVCHKGCRGERDAMKHALTTGHQNFGQLGQAT